MQLAPRRLLPHTPTPTRVRVSFINPAASGPTEMVSVCVCVRSRRAYARQQEFRTMQHHQHYLGPEEPGGPPPPSAREKRPAESSGHDDRHQPPQASSRKMKDTQKPRPSGGASASIRAVLQDFLEQQRRLDEQRQEATARHAQERLALEQQWRQEMQRLERERLTLERAWMEREEQRRVRDEARAERRDALLDALLNRLLRDDDL